MNNEVSLSSEDKVVAKKKKGIIPVIIIVLVLLVVLGGIYSFFYAPKNVMIYSMNSIYKDAISIIDKYQSSNIAKLSKDNVIKSTSNIAFNVSNLPSESELSGLDVLFNSFKLNVDNIENAKGNERLIKLSSTINNEELLGASAYTAGENQYIYLNNIFDKYIKMANTEYISYYDKDSTEDTMYILQKMKNSFIRSLKSSDFKKKRVELSYNGKTNKVSKITLTLTDKRIKEIIKYILNDIKNDSKDITAMSSILGGDVEASRDDLINKINDSIKALDNGETILENNMYLSIYVEGLSNKIVKYEFVDGTGVGIGCLVYQNKDEKTVHEISINSDGSSTILSLVQNKNNISYNLSSDNTKLIDGTVTNISKEVKVDKEYNEKQEIVLNLYNGSSISGTLTMTVNTDIMVGATYDKPDVSNSVDYDSLSEEDSTTINNNFSNWLMGLFMIQ